MSISYWSVNGFGINIEGDIFDLNKIVNLLNLDRENFTEEDFKNPFNGYLDDWTLQELIEEVLEQEKFEKHSKYLYYVNTGNNDLGEYLLYSPSYPWNMSEEEKALTEEDITNMIVEVLEAITILSRDVIVQNLEYVSVGGEG